MKRKKAEIGWSFIVKLIIGLIMLLALIFVAINAKEGLTGIVRRLADIF